MTFECYSRKDYLFFYYGHSELCRYHIKYVWITSTGIWHHILGNLIWQRFWMKENYENKKEFKIRRIFPSKIDMCSLCSLVSKYFLFFCVYFYTARTWFLLTHMLSNISQTKSKQKIELRNLIEYNKKNIFLQKLCRKQARGRLDPDLFLFFKITSYSNWCWSSMTNSVKRINFCLSSIWNNCKHCLL